MSVSIPAGSGGCGKTHSRPVNKGTIAKIWGLNCLPCEAYLKGEVPKTPDEESIHAVRTELGSQQLKMLEAFAAAKEAGIAIPPDAMWVLEQNFDPKILKGRVECEEGHENPAGSKFCLECGVSMTAKAPRGSLPAAGDDALAGLSISQLRKMCRDQGLPTGGKKSDLIERLS